MQESNALIDVSIVMPVYNEERIIKDAVRETYETMEHSGYTFEIIVVDDGSSDGTLVELRKLENIAIVKKYTPNKGKGYAIRIGTKVASGQLIVFYDSDLNIGPEQIVEYLDYIRRTDADMVIGSKRVNGSEVENTLTRNLLSIFYHLFSKVLLNVRVMDSQVGLKVIKSSAANLIIPNLTIDRFAFDIELLTIASNMKFCIIELPVRLKINPTNSDINAKAIEKMFVDTWRIYYRHTKNKVVRKLYQYSQNQTNEEYSKLV